MERLQMRRLKGFTIFRIRLRALYFLNLPFPKNTIKPKTIPTGCQLNLYELSLLQSKPPKEKTC